MFKKKIKVIFKKLNNFFYKNICIKILNKFKNFNIINFKNKLKNNLHLFILKTIHCIEIFFKKIKKILLNLKSIYVNKNIFYKNKLYKILFLIILPVLYYMIVYTIYKNIFTNNNFIFFKNILINFILDYSNSKKPLHQLFIHYFLIKDNNILFKTNNNSVLKQILCLEGCVNIKFILICLLDLKITLILSKIINIMFFFIKTFDQIIVKAYNYTFIFIFSTSILFDVFLQNIFFNIKLDVIFVKLYIYEIFSNIPKSKLGFILFIDNIPLLIKKEIYLFLYKYMFITQHYGLFIYNIKTTNIFTYISIFIDDKFIYILKKINSYNILNLIIIDKCNNNIFYLFNTFILDKLIFFKNIISFVKVFFINLTIIDYYRCIYNIFFYKNNFFIKNNFFTNIHLIISLKSNNILIYIYILYNILCKLLNYIFLSFLNIIILPLKIILFDYYFNKNTFFLLQNNKNYIDLYLYNKYFFFRNHLNMYGILLNLYILNIFYFILFKIKFFKIYLIFSFFHKIFLTKFSIFVFSYCYKITLWSKNIVHMYSYTYFFKTHLLIIFLKEFLLKVYLLKSIVLKLFFKKSIIHNFLIKESSFLFCITIIYDTQINFYKNLIFIFSKSFDYIIYSSINFIKCYFNLLTFQIVNTLLILLFVLVGGILPLWERKYLSLVQRRVGPKFVGYKGRLQFIADALKVLFKDYLYLFYINKYFFFLLPIVFLNLNLIFFVNIIFYGNCSYLNIEYNFLFLLFFSMYSNIILFLVGYVSKNKYTILSSNRILNLFFINEIFISTIFLFIFLLFNTFNFHRIFFFKNYISTILLLIPIIPLIFYLFLVDINKVPFDLVEAESELIMGYHVEYSGFLFGLFVLVEYLHLFFFIYVLYILFSFF